MFFHRMKWNCLDAFNASATLRGTPLWYPLSQFPATRHYPLPSISPSVSFLLLLFFIVYFLLHVPFFFPPTFAFLLSLHLSFFLFFFLFLSFFHRDACFLHGPFCPVREHLKKEKRLHEKTPEEGVRGFDSTKVREESNPLPLFCRRWRTPQKNVSALLKAGDARHRRKTIVFVSLSRYFSKYSKGTRLLQFRGTDSGMENLESCLSFNYN